MLKKISSVIIANHKKVLEILLSLKTKSIEVTVENVSEECDPSSNQEADTKIALHCHHALQVNTEFYHPVLITPYFCTFWFSCHPY